MEISGILGVLSKFLDAKSLFLPGANILKEAEADGPMKSTQNRDHRSYKIKYKNTICKYKKKIFIYKYAISKHLKGCSGAKDDQTKDKNSRDDDLIDKDPKDEDRKVDWATRELENHSAKKCL